MFWSDDEVVWGGSPSGRSWISTYADDAGDDIDGCVTPGCNIDSCPEGSDYTNEWNGDGAYALFLRYSCTTDKWYQSPSPFSGWVEIGANADVQTNSCSGHYSSTETKSPLNDWQGISDGAVLVKPEGKVTVVETEIRAGGAVGEPVACVIDDCSPESFSCCGSETATGGPVDMRTGSKLETVTDLTVALPGRDFALTRAYSSKPNLYLATDNSWERGRVGDHWTILDHFAMLSDAEAEQTSIAVRDRSLFLTSTSDSLDSAVVFERYFQSVSDEDELVAGGNPGWVALPSEHDIAGDTSTENTYTIKKAGEGEVVYAANPDLGAVHSDMNSPDYAYGRPMFRRDAEGHEWRYVWEQLDSVAAYPDDGFWLTKIVFGDSGATDDITNPGDMYGRVLFDWGTTAGAEYGRLQSVRVQRYDSTASKWVTTQAVEYTRKTTSNNTDGFHSDCGLPGDLVEVVTHVLVDVAESGIAAISVLGEVGGSGGDGFSKVTQYRYHDTTDAFTIDGTDVTGSDHQLKAVFGPEQIEYYAHALGESFGDTTVELAAANLASLPDDQQSTGMADVDLPSGFGFSYTHDLAAKIISYSTSDLVETQFIRGDDGCGCGGSSVAGSGVRYDYAQMLYNFSSASPDLDAVTQRGISFRMIESLPDGLGGFDPYRAHYNDFVQNLDHKSDDWTPTGSYLFRGGTYPVASAIAEVTSLDGDGEPALGDVWATTRHYSEQDLDVAAYSNTGPIFEDQWRLDTVSTHESATYTPVSRALISGAWTITVPIVGNPKDGLAAEYLHDEMGRSDVNRTLVLDSGGSATSVYKTASRTYPVHDDSSHQYRTDLVLDERSYSDDSGSTATAEVTHDYGYHDATAGTVAWHEISREPDPESQNGPGGIDDTTVMAYDDEGYLRWTKFPDGTLEYREYDETTGALIKLIANADSSAPGGDTSAGFDSADYGTPPGSWTAASTQQSVTEYEVDLLGRVTSVTGPDGVTTHTRREVRYEPLMRGGVPLMATVSLPAEITGATSAPYAAGPIGVRWSTAGGAVIRQSAYTVTSTYDPWADTYTIARANEVARSASEVGLSGVSTKSIVWHTIPATISEFDADSLYESTTEYDGLGRVVRTVDAEGGVTENIYDVMGRVIEVKQGREGLSGTTGDPITVVEYFYDGDHDGSPAHGIGNGNLVREVVHVGDGTTRETKHWYDDRNRRIGTKGPEMPYSSVSYDNLGRVTARASWGWSSGSPTIFVDDDPDSIPDAATADASSTSYHAHRTAYSTTAYSLRGNAYKRGVAIDPDTDNPTDFLESHTWLDSMGRTIASWSPTGAGTKTEYDGLGRAEVTYVTDRYGDALPGAANSYDDATSVGDGVYSGQVADHVIEQTEYTYKVSSGLDLGQLELVTRRMRRHDAAESGGSEVAGALAYNDDSSIATYTGFVYDSTGRQTDTLSYGTNSSNNIFEEAAAPTTFDTNRSTSAALITSAEFDDWGRSLATIDPEGTRSEVKLDAMGRQIAVIEASDQIDVDDITWSSSLGRWDVTGTLADDKDRVTSFVYDGLGNVVKRTAHMPSPAATQTTEYVYGSAVGSSSNPMDSLVASSSLLAEVRYPEESGTNAGKPGTASQYTVTHAYNALGEQRAMTDQNGTRHEYVRDGAGRVEHDRVTAFGSGQGVDEFIKRITTVYEPGGRVLEVLSYDNATVGSGTVKNGVGFVYNGLDMVTAVHQAHDGAPSTSSPAVEFDYDIQSVDSGNFARTIAVRRPSKPTGPHTLRNYDGVINNAVSRTASISSAIIDAFSPFAEYEYTGAGITVKATYPLAKMISTSDATVLDHTVAPNGERNAGEYPGFDQHGRVIWHAWVREGFTEHTSDTTVPDRTPLMARRYEYDKASNRIRDYDGRPGAVPADRDWVYTYDDLDRLKEAIRGQYDDASGTSGTYDMTLATDSYGWDLDLLGNWDAVRTDQHTADPVVFNGADLTENRLHNSANEITEIELAQPGGNPTSIEGEPRYDHNGNYLSNAQTGGAGVFGYTYDAWNRLRRVERLKSNPSNDITIAEYDYNGLGWRIARRADTAKGAHDGIDEARRYYYNTRWQMVEEEVDTDYVYDPDPTVDGFAEERVAQQFWGARYIDDSIGRIVDRDNDGTFVSTDMFYTLTDALFSVRTTTNYQGLIVGRINYSPYGMAQFNYALDLDNDGAYNVDDSAVLAAHLDSMAPNDPADSAYDPDADFDCDGDFDSTDTNQFVFLATNYSTEVYLNEDWVGDPSDSVGMDNSIGFAGYRSNLETGQYEARNRVYEPELGRWMQRDPAGYIDGSSEYQYARSEPTSGTDPYGLWKVTRNNTPTAVARTDEPILGDFVLYLSVMLGLNSSEFQNWLQPESTPIQLMDGSTTSFEDLGIFDRICPGQRFRVPNTIIFYDSQHPATNSIRAEHRSIIFNIGYHIINASDASGQEFVQLWQEQLLSKQLYGLYIDAHSAGRYFYQEPGIPETNPVFWSALTSRNERTYHLGVGYFAVCNTDFCDATQGKDGAVDMMAEVPRSEITGPNYFVPILDDRTSKLRRDWDDPEAIQE